MNNDDFNQIQSDLDMQLLTQMQIQQQMQGGLSPQEARANKSALNIILGILAVVGVAIALICFFSK